MVVAIFLYAPIDVDTNAEGYVFPTIDVDAKPLANVVASVPEEDEELDKKNDNNNNNRGGRYGNKPPEFNRITEYHNQNSVWIPVLAWSSGRGRARRGQRANTGIQHNTLSLTLWNDKRTPLIKNMVLAGETLPHGLLRCINMPKDGIMQVAEIEVHDLQFTSLSTGGSGGEDRLTNNITISSKRRKETRTKINMELREIKSQYHCTWDFDSSSGSRTLLSGTTKSLLDLAKEALLSNQKLTDKAKKTLQETEILSEHEFPKVKPQKDLTLHFTSDEASKKFKTGSLQERTRESLLSLASSKLNVEPSKIKALFVFIGKVLVELETDTDVADLREEDFIAVDLL